VEPLASSDWCVEGHHEMSNTSQLGGGEPITTREGVVITSAPLGFPSFPGHVGESMEVKGCENGG
jgi:hypothetical protein